MSRSRKDFLIIALVVILALTAFGTGFVANDVVRSRIEPSHTSANSEEFSVFWEAWEKIEASYIDEVPTAKTVTYGAIRGAIDVLDDPYTVFVEPVARELEKDRLRGSIGGVGASIRLLEDGSFVLTVIPGNPAEAAGLLDGDILLAVDGLAIMSGESVEDVVAKIRGEIGTEVTLTVVHEGESDPVDITIERAEILVPSVANRLLAEDPKIGYIQLTRFSGESSGEVEEAVVDLVEQGAESLILDLRHNGGGLLGAAIDVSDIFLNEVPVLHQVSRDEDEEVFKATHATVAEDIPLVVLIDGGSASSSEIVAGALQDHGRAILVGSKSFGKGSVQSVYDLSDGSSIHVTSARWFTPNSHQIDKLGLQPDIPVVVTEEAIASGQDQALLAAIEYLQG